MSLNAELNTLDAITAIAQHIINPDVHIDAHTDVHITETIDCIIARELRDMLIEDVISDVLCCQHIDEAIDHVIQKATAPRLKCFGCPKTYANPTTLARH